PGRPDESEHLGGRTTRLRPTRSYTTLRDVTSATRDAANRCSLSSPDPGSSTAAWNTLLSLSIAAIITAAASFRSDRSHASIVTREGRPPSSDPGSDPGATTETAPCVESTQGAVRASARACSGVSHRTHDACSGNPNDRPSGPMSEGRAWEGNRRCPSQQRCPSQVTTCGS